VALPDKLQRQQLLRELLASSDLRSQAEVRDVLAAHGIDAHQATVSRDLDELGAVKVRGADGSLVYRLAADPGPGSARARLDEVLRQFVTGVRHSGNLAVLGGGAAGLVAGGGPRGPPPPLPLPPPPPPPPHPVASAIDLAELDGVLATVSGDDTVLVVAEEALGGAALADALRVRLARPAT
jgi:transcriptional regulator of arginine metabolism